MPALRAAAVYLNVQQLIPEDRVAQAMADLFGAARLCPTASSPGARGRPRIRGGGGADRRARGPSRGAPSGRNRLSRRRQPRLHTASPRADLYLPHQWRGGVRPFAPITFLLTPFPLRAGAPFDKLRTRAKGHLLIEANSAVRAASPKARLAATLVLRTLIKRYNAIVRAGLPSIETNRPCPTRARTRRVAPDTIS